MKRSVTKIFLHFTQSNNLVNLREGKSYIKLDVKGRERLRHNFRDRDRKDAEKLQVQK